MRNAGKGMIMQEKTSQRKKRQEKHRTKAGYNFEKCLKHVGERQEQCMTNGRKHETAKKTQEKLGERQDNDMKMQDKGMIMQEKA